MGLRKNKRVAQVQCPVCRAIPGEWCSWETDLPGRLYTSRKPHPERVEASKKAA